jgi:hypothetical protein
MNTKKATGSGRLARNSHAGRNGETRSPAERMNGVRVHTAIHEAGHVIAARSLRLPRQSAQIYTRARNGKTGVTVGPPLPRRWSGFDEMADMVRRHTICLMARREAEIVCLGRYYPGTDSGDLRNIRKLRNDYIPPQQDKRILRKHARAIIERSRVRVEIVARALLRHGELTAGQIKTILQKIAA